MLSSQFLGNTLQRWISDRFGLSGVKSQYYNPEFTALIQECWEPDPKLQVMLYSLFCSVDRYFIES